VRNHRLNSADLDFNIQERIFVMIKNIIQRWGLFVSRFATFMQSPQSLSANGEPVHLGIVADDGVAVTGAADIKLETIRSVFQCQVKGRQRVFRGIKPGATVTEQ